MAAQKKSKPKAAKKAAPKKATSKPKPKARPRIQSPRSQPLPGMEQVTNKTLNRICEHLSDVRREMNRARGEEKDLMNQAVPVMVRDKVTAYRFSGVELVLVPGDVKLRVRTLGETKANANAEPEDEAEGQDAGATLDEMTAEPDDNETPDDERLAELDEEA